MLSHETPFLTNTTSDPKIPGGRPPDSGSAQALNGSFARGA